ncbi:putative ammonium transporter 2 [Asterias rubens]|uniref:putative ammonium transporter 2 n=1 Tax=Asterias rubens TaxID=7604 RepID=UPI001454F865|nr:putative ammonium transporter 2 [Asterias rubens]
MNEATTAFSTNITPSEPNTDGCPIYVVNQYVLPNPWDDPIWILTSAFVIFTMQSGFGLLESGTATSKNEVNIMVKNAVDVIFGGITYWMVGYAFSFGEDNSPTNGTSTDNNSFAGFGNFFLDVDSGSNKTGDLYSHFIFQLAFATTATTIVSGAMVERTRLEAYIIFSMLNTFVCSFPSHWVWAKAGFLRNLGVLDVAGGGPVHIAGGVTGLVATLMLRPRHRRYKTNDPPPMGSPTNAILGMFMLWWGWLGFNCGSTQGITLDKWSLAARSAVATICSSMAGGIAGIALSYLTKRRKFDIGYLIDGVLGSLVSITAMCTICPPKFALVIGLIGGCIACGGVELLNMLKIDDPVGVVPVHFFCGVWSLIAAGLFAKKDETNRTTDETSVTSLNGLFMGGGFELLGIQLLAIVCISAWCGIIACITLKVISLTIGLRFPFHEELLGADMVEHSIGPRKYDKIKKRLVDTSRYRRFEQPRRRLHSSMRQAEDFLGMRDEIANVSYDDIRRRFQDSESDDRNRSGARKIRFGPNRHDMVFSISNGNGHATVFEEEDGNHSNGEDVPHLEESNGNGEGSNGNGEQLNDNGLPVSKKRKFSAQLIRGAFRRRKIVLPKWQRKLGIENVAYIDNEQNMKIKLRKARDVQVSTGVGLAVVQESVLGDGPGTSDEPRPRSKMVDSSTQTNPTSEVCSTCVQTSVEDIYLRSIGVEADCSSIEMEVNFEADDETRRNSYSEKKRRKKFATDDDDNGVDEERVVHVITRAEYLV